MPYDQNSDQKVPSLNRIVEEVRHQLCLKVQNYDPSKEIIKSQISVRLLPLYVLGLFVTLLFLFAFQTIRLLTDQMRNFFCSKNIAILRDYPTQKQQWITLIVSVASSQRLLALTN